MTLEERKTGFIRMLEEAERLYGYTVVSHYTVRQLGVALLVEPSPAGIVPIEGWQSIPTAATPEPNSSAE